MSWTIEYDVAMEVAAHEALVRQAYRDSVGVLTWCVGMTNATGHRVERYIGKPQTLQHCMNIYAWALKRYARQVAEAFEGIALTKAQFAAAVSFHWNTGAIKQAAWVRYFKRGDVDKAREAIMNWVTPREVTGRRRKERNLFFDGVWTNNGTMTEYTRVTASMTPDWASAQRIHVEDELRRAFAVEADVILDQAPEPDRIPDAPTLSPDDDEPDIELPDAAPFPTPRPDQEAPMPKPSPMQQVSKAIGGAQGAGEGVGFSTGLLLLAAWGGYLPQDMDAIDVVLLNAALSAVAAPLIAFVRSYRAPKNAE